MSHDHFKKVRSLPRIRLGTAGDKTLRSPLPLKRVANFLRKKHHRSKDDSEIDSLSLEHQAWFHGQVTQKYAELAVTKDGDFLVSECPTNSGEYILTLNHQGARLNFPICKIHTSKTLKTKYRIDADVFDTVPELIYFYLECQVPVSQKLDAVIRSPVSRHTTLLSEDNSLGSFYPHDHSQKLSPSMMRNSSAPSLAFNAVDRNTETLQEAKSRMQSSSSSSQPAPTSSYYEETRAPTQVLSVMNSGIEKSHSCGSLTPQALGELPQEEATSAPDLTSRKSSRSTQRSRNVTSWHGDTMDEGGESVLPMEKSQSGDQLNMTMHNRPLPPVPADNTVRVSKISSESPSNPLPDVSLNAEQSGGPSELGIEPEHDYEEPLSPIERDNETKIFHPYENPKSPSFGIQEPAVFGIQEPAVPPGIKPRNFTSKKSTRDMETSPAYVESRAGGETRKPSDEEESIYQQRKTLGTESRYKLYCQLTDIIRDKLTSVLLKHDVVTLARHLTRVDLEIAWRDEIGSKKSKEKNKGENVAMTLEFIALPAGDKIRHTLVQRYRSLCLWVGSIVLGTGSLDIRQSVLVKLVEIAYVLQSSLGNLLGFMAIMEGLMSPLVSGLQQSWTYIENHHPAIAILYHSKLIPLAQCLNAGVRHPSISHSDICLPFFIPFAKLFSLSQQDILDDMDQWSVGYTDVDIDVIFAHLDNVRAFTIQYESYRIEAESRFRGYKVVPELYEYFTNKVEVHAIIGVRADHRDAYTKVESLLRWFAEYTEPPTANTDV